MTQQRAGQRLGSPPLPLGGERLVIGLGSGSSLDGIDAALVGIRGSCEIARIELKRFLAVDYDDETREALIELFEYATSTVDKLTRMHAILGELFADAAIQVSEAHGVGISQVDCIGIWGHMMYHLPTRTAPFEWRGRQLGSSLQIGDLNRVAVRTGIPVIGDMANPDIAAGGNGAPGTPIALYDYAVYHEPGVNRVVQNIGGIGNCNLIPASGGIGAVVGFDTGPGVMVIDGLARHYSDGTVWFDRDGESAARGTVDEDLLEELMQDPFIQRGLPKAAGRENFGSHFVRHIVERGGEKGLGPDDVIATGTALTAASIALGYERYVIPECPGPSKAIDEVVVGGGGARNPTLLRMIAERTGCAVTTDEAFGIDSFAQEAMMQAHAGYEAFLGHTNHAPWQAGASVPTHLGLVAPGYSPRPAIG